MQRKETITLTDQRTVAWICDRCGSESADAWRESRFAATETVVEHTTGDHYPDSGDGVRWFVELCPSCAQWLRETLEAAGVTVQVEKWSW